MYIVTFVHQRKGNWINPELLKPPEIKEVPGEFDYLEKLAECIMPGMLKFFKEHPDAYRKEDNHE